jgi:hypothetical protein
MIEDHLEAIHWQQLKYFHNPSFEARGFRLLVSQPSGYYPEGQGCGERLFNDGVWGYFPVWAE